MKFECPHLNCKLSEFHMWKIQQVVMTLKTKIFNYLVLTTLQKGLKLSEYCKIFFLKSCTIVTNNGYYKSFCRKTNKACQNAI